MVRLIDVLISLLMILAGALFIPVIILKLIIDGRPLFYLSRRVGKDNKLITTYKFRTMINDRKKIDKFIDNLGDKIYQRIPINSEIYTKFGRLFERFQLVELPQLINIIIGNMSLVGSRPLPKDLNLKLEREFGEEFVKRRMNVLPGLTGISQIMGKNDLTDLQRLEVEVAYSEFKNKSNEMSVVFLNLLIIFETFAVVILRGKVRISTKIILSRLDFDKNIF